MQVCNAVLNLVLSEGYAECGFGNAGVGGGHASGVVGGRAHGVGGDRGNGGGGGGRGKGGGDKRGNNGGKARDATEKPRKPCGQYNFDSSRCKMVNDRLLCGYDNNIGGAVAFKDRVIELPDRCRLRGKRIECGYVQPPYTNPRRPSAHRQLPYPSKDADEVSC